MRPPDPAAAVAAALDSHGVAGTEDFEAAYRRPHHDYDDGRELSLVDHVAAALASRGADPDRLATRGGPLLENSRFSGSDGT